MRVRLTRRLATSIDGIDLSTRRVGDILDVTGDEAALLIAEGWATRIAKRLSSASACGRADEGTAEAEGRGARLTEELRGLQQKIRGQASGLRERRRAEDLIRDAWHDEHATVFRARASARGSRRARRR